VITTTPHAATTKLWETILKLKMLMGELRGGAQVGIEVPYNTGLRAPIQHASVNISVEGGVHVFKRFWCVHTRLGRDVTPPKQNRPLHSKNLTLDFQPHSLQAL
jgi:hypothetical protein